MYQNEFEHAIERTKSFNLDFPEVNYRTDTLLSDEKMAVFPNILRDNVGEININDLVAQCLFIHHKLRGPISRIFSSSCYFTIGHVETNDRLMFHQSEDNLKDILQNGIKGNTSDIHAWLTLPTMEILDFSLPTSYAILNNLQEGRGAIIATHPDTLKQGMKYHPMLIGDDFLKKSGGLVEFN